MFQASELKATYNGTTCYTGHIVLLIRDPDDAVNLDSIGVFSQYYR